MSYLTVRVMANSDEFESLRETWNELLARSSDNNIYLTWEWLFTWWKHYGEDKKLNILLIEDGDRIIGIAPLIRTRYGKWPFSFEILENICSMDIDYGGIILTERKEESVISLLAYLKKMIHSSNIILRMTQIPEDSEFLTLVRRQYPRFSKSLVLEERILTTCPYIPLPATWDEYFHSLRRKRRGNLQRALKSLQKDHNLELKRFVAGDNLEKQMQEFYELHQRRWERLNISGTFSVEKVRKFYLDVADAFSQKGWLDLSFMTVDGQAVSAVCGFNYNQRFYYGVTAFDPKYAEYSVGNLHIMHLIEDAIKSGTREFDFLIGDEIYKLYWTRLARSNTQLVLTKGKFGAGSRLRLFSMIMRLGVICKRSLLENYRLYMDTRREQNLKKKMKQKEE